MTNLETAKTILAQLGGNKFIVMTGSKNFAGDATSLRFKVGRNSGNVTHVVISLNMMDTYDMVFLNIRGTKIKNIAEHDGVYNDQLQTIFTSVTGLYTSL